MSAKASPMKVISHYKTSEQGVQPTEKEIRVRLPTQYFKYNEKSVVVQGGGVVKFYNHRHFCCIAAEKTFREKCDRATLTQTDEMGDLEEMEMREIAVQETLDEDAVIEKDGKVPIWLLVE